MKNLARMIRLAGVVFFSTGVGMAGNTPATPAVPAVKKYSNHAVSAPAAKPTAPIHISPPLLKPGLPVDAGRPRNTAAIGGLTGANGHKDGTLNGTEIKRHP